MIKFVGYFSQHPKMMLRNIVTYCRLLLSPMLPSAITPLDPPEPNYGLNLSLVEKAAGNAPRSWPWGSRSGILATINSSDEC